MQVPHQHAEESLFRNGASSRLRISKNKMFGGYCIDWTSTADKIQQMINDGVKLYTELESNSDTNKEGSGDKRDQRE